ncbi:hypothetical protein [Absidia glauca]|uniref:Uncharacterized protein n=1 Tax=Absidia glauca TaxID=4829 RepID=A0A163KB09_ABSGL|nr:hypothetical protein [Absidia glauca]
MSITFWPTRFVIAEQHTGTQSTGSVVGCQKQADIGQPHRWQLMVVILRDAGGSWWLTLAEGSDDRYWRGSLTARMVSWTSV